MAAAITINPGYVGSFSIQDQRGNEISSVDFSDMGEAKAFREQYLQSTTPYSGWRMSFIPTRTDNLKNFMGDLFFPNFINSALKVDNVFLRIIASILCICFDLITLLPRLIMTPYSFSYNAKKATIDQPHPLLALITPSKRSPGATEEIVNKASDEGVFKVVAVHKFTNVVNGGALYPRGLATQSDLTETVAVVTKQRFADIDLTAHAILRGCEAWYKRLDNDEWGLGGEDNHSHRTTSEVDINYTREAPFAGL